MQEYMNDTWMIILSAHNLFFLSLRALLILFPTIYGRPLLLKQEMKISCQYLHRPAGQLEAVEMLHGLLGVLGLVIHDEAVPLGPIRLGVLHQLD